MGAMGVPLTELPRWNDIQFVTAQFATKPLMDDAKVDSSLIVGPRADKPLELDIPLFVSDMSFGALSEEAKIALSRGAELAGTGICSGEGGMLPEEQAENTRYLYELASARFGWELSLVERVQAFHFKGGQGAKTGTGGHLPGNKVTEKTPTFDDLVTPADFKKVADQVRERSGGIPIGFKMSAQHIEDDIDFALEASADYIILDGRGGGTGAAPLLFRDNISVPTIPALARARRHLDKTAGRDVTLIITGGLRVPEDFAKAMAMGADGVAVSNAALQAVGCVGARMCNTNNCPAGIATQKPELRALIDVDAGAKRLATFFGASVELMQLLARACGHSDLRAFSLSDLTTWKHDMANLSGVSFGGPSRE
jgi:glutamate synthase domain-containing protein 2